MRLIPLAVTVPTWLGGLAADASGEASRFGAFELLLTSIAVVIIFLILGPRWLRDRRNGTD